MEGIKWEKICEHTYRLSVCGGWIYRWSDMINMEDGNGNGVGALTTSMCFVATPPPDHTTN